jgi:hypothetical protein
MKTSVLTEEIISLDCELSVYRKGCLSVSLNLRQGLMVWRESRQWCNNFIRSLTNEQVRALRSRIDALGIAKYDRPDGDMADEASGDGTKTGLKLTAYFADRQVSLSGDMIDFSLWIDLRREIEKLSRVPFSL